MPGRALRSAATMAALALAAPAVAQTAPAELDPSAPLDAMPDLGVDWPDLDSLPQPLAQPLAAPTAPEPVVIADASAEQRYAVTVEGLSDVPTAAELAEAFERQSSLRAEADEPANAAQIDWRSRADAELLTELLRSHGYYDASVEPRIERANGSLLVILAADPGEQYLFESVALPGIEHAGPEAAGLVESFGVRTGDPVIASEVIAGGIALKVALGERGFALAEVGEQDIVIDHETHRARLVLPVDPGPVAAFGVIRVTGRPPFSAAHVARIARFEPGETFRRSRLDDLRRALIATGLVATAETRVVPAADGRTVDVAVHLEPAPMRTIAGELGYGSGEGARIEASWQHRNLFNPEGALTLRGVLGTQEQLAAIAFRRNNFLERDQVLNLLASASHTDRVAYEARTLLLSAGIERQTNIIWQKKWTWGIGADLLATNERGVFSNPAMKETRTFLIAALPVSLGYDGSDDLLDPTRGFRLSGRISPEISARGGSFTYARSQIDASGYQPVSPNVVAAGRVRLGTIAGAQASEIAPTRRFYSGGGGSVRGYGYQRLGPRDLDGDPVGGRGLAEFALEARFRVKAFGADFGIVPFLDGGTLSNDILPGSGRWQFGAGIGARYYSGFGPIRVDVGTPLNPRQGDSPIAVTVSLGQAF